MTSMVNAEELNSEIRAAFAGVPRPGNWALCETSEGVEGRRAADTFSPMSRWQDLDARFIERTLADQSLSFLSDEGFRYFLPAYLISDLTNPNTLVFGIANRLVCWFTCTQRDTPVSPERFGDRTWADVGRYKCSTYTSSEARAILAFLRWKMQSLSLEDPIDAEDAAEIGDAIDFYWSRRSPM